MRYWDASAIVPLIVSEDRSAIAREWLSQDPGIVTWAWTRVELVSAVERRARRGELTRTERRACLDAFAGVAELWDEVVDLAAVRGRAIALLSRHSLRAADAAQLGAALVVAEGDPSALTFVCLDETLALAAEREGFPLLTRSA
ncbi:MAG TPA: type II toxin-antitoxin system VapC family toxin [Candidatus Polarisedimenticolaceae bacterium]|nr:type II toxin-antitoxin system VapC family toxin [Candidatus Polarisedimenticolaceae bacterium]